MRTLRVYVDTSVFGGVFDDEFAEPSQRFFDRVRAGEFIVLVSQTTLGEIAGAPVHIRRFFDDIPEEMIIELADLIEVEELAQAYIAAGVVAVTHLADARHVAAAVVAEAEFVLSWNFRHLVNYRRQRGYNAISELNGYRRISIMSPLEVFHDEEQDV
jgi:predicted nucleic acid-binding protein